MHACIHVNHANTEADPLDQLARGHMELTLSLFSTFLSSLSITYVIDHTYNR